jgi:hypothetical protein
MSVYVLKKGHLSNTVVTSERILVLSLPQTLLPNVVFDSLALLLRILKVPGSNIDPQTDCPN